MYTSTARRCVAACGSECLWQELLPLEDDAPLPPTLPNEPLGRLNLRWPPSVPYIKPENDGEREHEELDLAEPLAEHPQAMSGHSLIYGDALAPDEFRLICLSVARNEEGGNMSPLHISLEIYGHARYPEYETVSYAWGGEDGDNTPYRPIFIGEFWDVLFQTRNCWEMLRFMQPFRGIRIVWVDALCINQRNPKERGQQVAKMCQIYEQCSRVIIYLGPLVSLRDPLPHRYRLCKLEESTLDSEMPDQHQMRRLSLSHLLDRRYFTRIWVIQELVLAPRAVVRLGNIDFSLDPPIMDDLKALVPPQQWDSFAAPWFQHATRRTFTVDNIYDLVRLTSKSRASDPRDRLFAVLGLLGSNKEPPLQPDYTLSAAHVFTGFFAYSILALRKAHLFFKAKGLLTGGYSPTWTPDWGSEEAWEDIFTPEKLTTDEVDTLMENIQHNPPHMKDRFGPFYTLHEINTGDDDEGRSRPRASLQEPPPNLFYERPWYLGGTVHTDTGALSINLTRFCTLSSRPMFIKRSGELGIFEVRGLNSILYLASRSDVEAITHPGKDHLFILNPGKSSPLIYLILRDQDLPKTFQLVASCQRLLLGFQTDRHDSERIQSLSLGGLQRTVRDALQLVHLMLTWSDVRHRHSHATYAEGISMANYYHLETAFLSEGDGFKYFPIYRGIINDKLRSSPGLVESFLSCVPRSCEKSGFLSLAIGGGHPDFDERKAKRSYTISSSIRRVPDLRWYLRSGFGVSAEIRTEDVCNWLISFTQPEVKIMEDLMRVLKIDLDGLEDLLREKTDLGDEYDHVAYPIGFDMVRDFDIDGSTFHVDIL